MSICKASEIPRNEAYIEVRRSASGTEGLRPGGTRDEDNAADGRFPTASIEAASHSAPFLISFIIPKNRPFSGLVKRHYKWLTLEKPGYDS